MTDTILHNKDATNPAAAWAWMMDHGMDVVLMDEIVHVKSTARAAPAPDVQPSISTEQTSETPVPQPRPTAAVPVPTADLADNLALAQTLAADAQTIDDLGAAIQGFDGIPLKRHASTIVFADGNPAASVMIMGDMPSDDDDASGKPFTGEAGEMLTKMFGAIGLDRAADTLYITHLINWRPPGNRSATDAEIALSRVFACRHIELVRPKILVLVGATATKAILNTDQGIMRCHGKWHDYALSDGQTIRAMPIYHPAFLMKTPTKKRDAWDDLQAIKAVLDGMPPAAS